MSANEPPPPPSRVGVLAAQRPKAPGCPEGAEGAPAASVETPATVLAVTPTPSVGDDADTSPETEEAVVAHPLPPPDSHDAAMDEVFRSAVGQATAGSMHGGYIARLIWHDLRQKVPLDLPPLDSAADIARAHVVVIAEAAAGRRTPQDALAYSRMFEYRRRSIEMLEIEPVLRKLNEANVEARKKAQRGR